MIHIRWMVKGDVQGQGGVVQHCDPTGIGSDAFIQFLRQPHIIGQVAEDGDRMLGWIMYEMGPWWVHVHDMDIRTDSPFEEGMEALKALVYRAMRAALQSCGRRPVVTLQVADKDLPLQLLLKDLGFKGSVLDRQTYLFQYGQVPAQVCLPSGTNRIAHLLDATPGEEGEPCT